MPSAYVRQLQALVELSRSEQALAEVAGREAEAQAARDRLKPLDERLARLLATIPNAVQREGLSLPELVPMLRGRCRATADAGQLGTALRRLGWRRERRWRGGDIGFKALWLPPEPPVNSRPVAGRAATGRP